MKKYFDYAIITKNRGWRGLAQIELYNHAISKERQFSMVFSFSPEVWEDLIINHKIVVQDEDYYYVLTVNEDINKLPRRDQQRSVLIKYFNSRVCMNTYSKTDWTTTAPADDKTAIYHFIHNRNNHTQSEWNAIGMRVNPMI